MLTLEQIQEPVKQEMKDFEPHFKQAMKTKVPLLSIITNYIYRRKGKQMRPTLVFLTSKLTGETSQGTFTGASLIELLHTATLIHDDVVDEAYERRGFFSINALWKSKIAVLVGDYLLAKGLLLAVDNEEFQLLKIVSDAVKEISEGELIQIQKSRKLDITEEEYFEIIGKKTASLIAACAAVGAKSSGASEEVIQKMKDFGMYLGIAFQIRDDLFDYEKTNLIGKPTGNDIKEKKITLPLIYALRNSNNGMRKKVLKKISRHNHNRQKVEEIIEYVKSTEGLNYTHEKMLEYKQKALDIVNEFPDSEVKTALLNFVEFTVSRKK